MKALHGPTRLVLVRHGESQGNVADRAAQDQEADRLTLEFRDADMPLSQLGEAQAQALGDHLAQLPEDERPTAVFASPYGRAATTAREALSRAGLDVPISIDERLRERELGIFDGVTGRGIEHTHPEEAERRRWLGKFYYRPPSGESWADVALRVRQYLLTISVQPDPPERVWVFTHQAVILAFRVAMEGIGEKDILEIDAHTPIANCAVTTYAVGEDGTWQLTAFADDRATRDTAVPTTHETPAPDPVVEEDGHEQT